MIEGIQIKVCGLTSFVDAELADGLGADYLGFILHPKSPRYIPLAQYRSMAARLPERKKVGVAVEPSLPDLLAMKDAGFDRFQVHFRSELPLPQIEAYSKAVGASKLWLAPKFPSGVDVAREWLSLADTIVFDTFDPALFGGTGRTGDWPKFKRHRSAHPENTWVLSGGLNPENVGGALTESGARFVDVNSGVESSPGIKDHERLRAFVAAVRGAKGA